MLQPVTKELAGELAKLSRRLERERKSRLDAEAIAEKGLRELYEKQQQLQVLEKIAVAANQTASVRDTLQFAINTVCQFTGWMLGHAYLSEVDGDSNRLISTSIWYAHDPERVGAFCSATEKTHFKPGIGLPGRVLATGAPAWIVDVTEDNNFPRAEPARLAGIKAGFAFPVLVGNEVAAVLEFFTDKLSAPDQMLLRLMSQVGTQLGRVVERKRAEDRLIHDASHDPLTGLPNRSLFMDRLKRAVARNKRHPASHFAVLFIDLDRFKVVNDSLGHGAGDHLIVQVATRLLGSLRSGDIVAREPSDGEETMARLGGDEFTVLLDDIRDPSDAVLVADRIKQTLELPFEIEGQEVYASASIGIASSATGYASGDEVLRDADLAMYRAKALGKARYEVYDQTMHAVAVKRLELESNLRRAFRKNEFVLHYQPIVSFGTSEVVGFEALVRWRKSETELVYPGEFIQVAEDTGLILSLGIWVLREACRTMQQWNEEFPRKKPLSISVNVSARQFAQPDFVFQVGQIISEIGIKPETVRLEITESVAMADADRAVHVLSQLRELGVRISIDDFGTGYSSLSYLQRYPVDVLKIDRSFISQLNQSGEGLQIVNTIVALAQNLGMDVVAEGIETEAHVAYLRSTGCKFAQGYFFSRPLDADGARNLLETSTSQHSYRAPGRRSATPHRSVGR